MSQSTTLIGRKLGGFEILDIIGEGGMGTVFRAVQSNLGRQVALKVLRKRLLSKNREFAARFLREARLAAKVNHHNIVQVFDAGAEGEVYFMAMELVEGRNVGEALSAAGRFPFDAAAETVRQAASGLEAARAHSLIHRDMKPDNLIASREGIVKIMDFGLAKNTEDPVNATRAGVLMGTPSYISPEQVQGKDADHRSDLYALGVSLYELISGAKPFDGESTMIVLMKHVKEPVPDLRKARPDTPPGLAEIARKLMEKDPGRRVQTPSELADMLRPFAGGKGEEKLAGFLFRECAQKSGGPGKLATLFARPGAGHEQEPPRQAEPGPGKRAAQGRYISKGIIEIGKTAEDRRRFEKYAKLARDFEKAADWTRASEFCRKALGACGTGPESDEMRSAAARFEKLRKGQAGAAYTRARAAMEAGENAKAVKLIDAYLSLNGADASASALRKQSETTPEGFKYLGLNRQRNHEYECIKAGYAVIYINGAEAVLGGDDGSKDEKPGHRARLDSFFMGKYPVTNAQYARFLDSAQGSGSHAFCHPLELVGHNHEPLFQNDARWNKPNHPVVGVDWFDAWAFASWAGLCLPTEAMWEFTATGGGASRYPWGDGAPAPDSCNYFESRLNGTTPVDRYRTGAAPSGVMDLSGNVFEWCVDWYHRGFYGREAAVAPNPCNTIATARKSLRGGAWTSPAENLRSRKREADYPTSRQNYIGFRCAMAYY